MMEQRPISVTALMQIQFPKRDTPLFDLLILKIEGDIFMVALQLAPKETHGVQSWSERTKIGVSTYFLLRDRIIRRLLSLIQPEDQAKVILALVGFFSLLDSLRDDAVCYQIAEMIKTMAWHKEEL